MCSYAWIDLRGGCALLSAQGRRPWEPSASTGTSFGWRDDVELFTTLALVVRSYSHNRLWGFKRVCGSILGFLRERCAVLGRRSIWAVLRLVAAWQFGTGVLWASVACFVNCTLIRQHPCPRVACYCAFAAQSGGGWWLAGEGARCLSVRGTRTLFRDRAGRGSNRCPGFSPWTDASDVFASVAPSRLRIAWECQRDSRPLVFVVALARCFRFAPACFCLLS